MQSEMCYTKDHFFDLMKEQGITEMKVIGTSPERNTGMFWCAYFWEIGEVGESCGHACEKYKPRNGKNGICSHYRVPMGEDKEVTLKLPKK